MNKFSFMKPKGLDKFQQQRFQKEAIKFGVPKSGFMTDKIKRFLEKKRKERLENLSSEALNMGMGFKSKEQINGGSSRSDFTGKTENSGY